MSNLRAKGWMIFPIAALVFAALGAVLLARGDLASGSATATVRIGSGHGNPGSQVTVPLEALGVPQPGVGAVTVDIVYDDSLEPTAWNKTGSPLDMVNCSLTYALHTIRCAGISAAGVSGDVPVANITFHLVGAAGECDPLDVRIRTFADPNGNPISASDTDGQICIDGGPSPTPEATATATVTPTPTPPPTPTAGAKVRIGSGWGGQSSEVTVPLEALDVPAPPGLGAITVDIVYDDSLEPTAWNKTGSPLDMATCSLAYATNTIRCSGISAAGVSGDVLVANLTFRLVAPPDECDPLDVQIRTFADPDGNPIPVTDEDGEICIGGSPTPTARVRIGSGRGEQGSEVTVPLEALGLTQALGAITIDIVYDDSLEPTAWNKTGSPLDMVTCKLDYALHTIRCSGISAEGVFGDIVVSNITFHLVGAAGECDPLGVQIVTFADPDGNPIPATDENGEICIGVPPCEVTVTIGSGEVPPGGTITVPLEVRAVCEPGLGAYVIDVSYDSSIVDPVGCTPDPDGVIFSDDCNQDFAPGVVRCGGFNVTDGLIGQVALCDITFEGVGEICQTSPLTLDVIELSLTNLSEPSVIIENGSIHVGASCGDVDCGGSRQMKDAMMIAQYKMGLRCGSDVCGAPGPNQCIYLPAADVNCNDQVQMLDAMLVAQCVMGLIDCDCNCCWPCQ